MRWPLIDFVRSLPLRVQLTLLNTAAVLLGLVLVLVSARTAVRIALINEAGDVLLGEVRATAMALNELYPDVDAVVAELRRKTLSHVDRGWFVHLVNGDRVTVWRSPTCPDVIASKPVDESRTEALMTLGDYMWARRRITDPSAVPYYVRIGLQRHQIDARVDAVTTFLLPIGVAVAVCTPLAAYWLAFRATQPIADILSVAESLSPTTLGDRLKIRGTGDELDRLSSRINTLLDDVANHVDRQQQFVADAAHEIRGPLTAIQSTLEVAANKDRSEADYRDTIDDVLLESRHLSKLANDLLLLAEFDTDDPRTPEPVDLERIVRTTVGMFYAVAEDRGIDLLITAATECVIRGEPRHLRQLLANFLDNAIRFTPQGGAVKVELLREQSGQRCRLSVRDTGIGIEAAHIPYIFDRFYQVDPGRPRADASRGGGLGLAICRSIVERHCGVINLTSRPGEGTTIAVSLPVIVAEPGRPVTTPANSSSSRVTTGMA
ncbi:MAG: sensor histidine kinase [Planctomycetia bacterium]|nr:sensor histidine kinase [Planctomycetia bacterium]